jgi:hypothetical protein
MDTDTTSTTAVSKATAVVAASNQNKGAMDAMTSTSTSKETIDQNDGVKSVTTEGATTAKESIKKRQAESADDTNSKKRARPSKSVISTSNEATKKLQADLADDSDSKNPRVAPRIPEPQWITQSQITFTQKVIKGKEVCEKMAKPTCGGRFLQLRGENQKHAGTHYPIKVFQSSCFADAVKLIAKTRKLDVKDPEVRKEIENELEYIPRVRVALPLQDSKKQAVEPGLLWDLQFHKDDKFCYHVNENGSKASRITLKD